MKIFTINSDLELVIHKPIIMDYESFKTIVKRVYKVAGDTDGRDKLYNKKLLKFIYFYSDKLSEPNRKAYNDRDKISYARLKAGLDETFHIDAEIQACINDYIQEQSTVADDVVKDLIKSFNNSKKVIRKINNSIEDYIEKVKLNKDESKEALGLIQSCFEFSKELPGMIKDLNKALIEYETVLEKDSDTVRGTTESVPASYERDTSL